MRTKNNKYGTTYLLNIPDLLPVVREWDGKVRSHLPPSGLWFAPLVPTYGGFWTEPHEVGKHRHAKVRNDLKRWCRQVGLEYHSPHKFRHGHASYSVDRARTVADLKAISQNLMHANMKITDELYAVLSDENAQQRINSLGQGSDQEIDIADMLRTLAAQFEHAKKGQK